MPGIGSIINSYWLHDYLYVLIKYSVMKHFYNDSVIVQV